VTAQFLDLGNAKAVDNVGAETASAGRAVGGSQELTAAKVNPTQLATAYEFQ